MPKHVTISKKIGAILARATIAPHLVRLPDQLPRDEYLAVDKVLRALGGKWDRRAGAHVFPFDIADQLRSGISAGQVIDRKQALQFFETPPDVARELVARALVEPGDAVLEPSAGLGALIKALPPEVGPITAVEIDAHHCECLRALARPRDCVVEHDFLDFPFADRFDVVVMNPPFSGDQDMKRIRAAWTLLKPGGRLAAICSAGITFRTDRRAVEFDYWLRKIGAMREPLPHGAFAASGTRAGAVMIWATREETPAVVAEQPAQLSLL